MNVNKPIAYLFPGQGAQYSNMALDLLESDTVKQLFETASDIFEKDVKELLRSDFNILKRTDISQPAVTIANLAAYIFLKDKGIKPAVCAGFSLGEYAALVCAGIINEADCFRLVKTRGNAMQKVIDKHHENFGDDDLSSPGMAAVVGISIEQIIPLINQWITNGLKDLHIANINSPRQLVISGTAIALDEAKTRLKEAGIKRVVRLPVAGPFHSPLISDAVKDFKPVLDTVTFRDPVIPIFSNVTGKMISSGSEAKELAIRQITNPVCWVEQETAISISGIEVCLEAGPGGVLQGLWQDMKTDIPIFAAGTAEDIYKCISFL